MKIHVSGRRSGKTTAAIKKANEVGGYMIVATRQEAERLSRLPEGQRPDRFPITFDELLRRREMLGGNPVQNYVVDDAEKLIARLLPTKTVHAVWLTDNEEN